MSRRVNGVIFCIKFKLWPGQIKIIEETFKERVVQVVKKFYADYASWMIMVTYKVEDENITIR
jgi:hypothetical protein